jgi:hypothetical protein
VILWRWLRNTAWPFSVAVVNRFIEDEGWVLSGHLAFSGMLALIPFLIFATALTGYVIGAEGGEAVLNALFAAVPDYVAKTLEPVIHEVGPEMRRCPRKDDQEQQQRIGIDHARDRGPAEHRRRRAGRAADDDVLRRRAL